MLSEWFGFHSTTELPNGPPKVQIAFDKHSWSRMLSFMMYTNSADPRWIPSDCFSRFTFPWRVLRQSSCRIFMASPLSNFGNPQIAVRRTSYLAKQRNEEKAPTLALYSVQLLEGDYYGRRIFVWNASTALAIKRLDEQRSRSVGHIAEYLISRGMSFVLPSPAPTCSFRPTTPALKPSAVDGEATSPTALVSHCTVTGAPTCFLFLDFKRCFAVEESCGGSRGISWTMWKV